MENVYQLDRVKRPTECGQAVILLAMGLHPSFSGDDIPSVMSISHSQTTIQSTGTPDPPPGSPHRECCAESHIDSATKFTYLRMLAM